jgi:uncharacterized protein (TIGR02757 family)
MRNDPVQFPRSRLQAGAGRQDIEAVALLSAMLAYGRVALFLPVIERILAGCPPPYPAGFLRPRAGFAWPAYRLSTAEDLRRFAGAIGRVTAEQGGLWEAFRPGWLERHSIWDGLYTLHRSLLTAAGTPAARGLRHLLPDPAAGSCSKRWMLFLRWVARPEDGLDLGQWPAPPPSALILPVDRHMGRFARRWGWTRRAQDDRIAAEEITEALRRICPEDPLRYDFAISHLGIDGLCSHGRRESDCRACGLRKVCQPGRRF